jgi:nitroimidazol reductase NimA-like FMN-containing flavoprotein (pyridoxamine 5'-phosphate oxidase superfamily)
VRLEEKAITDEAIMKKILKATPYVTIAMSKDNTPYLASLSHGYNEEGNCIYIHCKTEGKKIDYLKSNHNVWGQALLQYMNNFMLSFYASVHFYGKVSFLSDPNEKRHAIECIIKQQYIDPKLILTKLQPEDLKQTLLARIDIEFMTGKQSQEMKGI